MDLFRLLLLGSADLRQSAAAPVPKSYLAAVVSDQGARLIAVAAGLWLTPLALSYLGRDAYGLFALTMSVIAWLSVIDLGTPAGLQVHLTQVAAKGNAEEASRYVSSAFMAQLVMSAVLLAVGGLGIAGFSRYFPVPREWASEAAFLAGCLLLAAVLRQPVRIESAILAAYHKVHLNHLVQTVSVVVRVGCAVLLLARGWGLASLGIAHVTAVAVTAFLSTLLRRGLVPGVSFRPSLVSRDHLRKISRSGVWFSLGGLAGILIVGADRAVAAKLLSLEAVTVLYLSSRLYGLAADLLAPIAESARPTLGRLLGQRDHAEAHRVYRLVNRISLSLAVVAALAIWAGNRTFVTAWVGPENYGGWALDAALALGLVARLAPLPSRAALASGLVVKSQTLVRLGEGALNLALSVALTPLLGLAGLALSTLVAAALTSLWCLPRLAGRLFPHQRKMQRCSDGLAVALLAVPLAGVAGWSRLAASQAGGYTGAALAMAITLAAGLTLIWWTGMKARTRSALRRLLPA